MVVDEDWGNWDHQLCIVDEVVKLMDRGFVCFLEYEIPLTKDYRKKLFVVFSMVEKRKKMHNEMMARFAGRKRVMHSAIPFLADVEKMGVYRQPVTARLPRSVATKAYENLWDELETVLERL